MQKLVLGLGIYHKGKFQGSIDNRDTREYTLWYNMIRRCVPGGEVQQKNTSYLGCTIHQDFIHFQDFAEWCQNQIGFDKKWVLDKDIIIQGNKVYGPETCCFVPESINKMLTHKKKNCGDLPTGVFKGTSNFCAQVTINSKVIHLGSFTDPISAHNAYKRAKQSAIRTKAEEFKDVLDSTVYNALLKYEIL